MTFYSESTVDDYIPYFLRKIDLFGSLWFYFMAEYVVTGREIETLIRRNDLENEYSLRRVTKQLDAKGLFDDLRKAGCKHGDNVIIGNFVFEFDENM